jgi:hypothetical protein
MARLKGNIMGKKSFVLCGNNSHIQYHNFRFPVSIEISIRHGIQPPVAGLPRASPLVGTQQLDKQKATANALSTFGITVRLLGRLAYLRILRKKDMRLEMSVIIRTHKFTSDKNSRCYIGNRLEGLASLNKTLLNILAILAQDGFTK